MSVGNETGDSDGWQIIDQDELERQLQVLVGLPMTIARDFAGMKAFHFGAMRPFVSKRKRSHGRTGIVGSHVFHLQCAWRIVKHGAIVTGWEDCYIEPDGIGDADETNLRNGTQMAVRLGELFGTFHDDTNSWVDATGRLIVSRAVADPFGGADIEFEDGHRLQIFPAGSAHEQWRFITPVYHVVIEDRSIQLSPPSSDEPAD